MPRAKGRDLCELFGYAPDDRTQAARLQWKSQKCPFVGNLCVKHGHPQQGEMPAVYGSCSVLNKGRKKTEEVIICPQRLYADNYMTLKDCFHDAVGDETQVYLAREYSSLKQANRLPQRCGVLLGHNSPGEIKLSRRTSDGDNRLSLSLDWVIVLIVAGKPELIVPCEVQSIDVTGNYFEAWSAYAEESAEVPDSKHGMNWANVWKRLIPQLIFKGEIARASNLCHSGIYFILPDRVYAEFRKWVGAVPAQPAPGPGVLTAMTYALGPEVPFGSIRQLVHCGTFRSLVNEFARAFGSGQEVRALGPILDAKILSVLASL